ncbi:hypothetical protein LELG_05585 [Lodderomyces elongisporus NRRL YB-4239]|uniref:Uncharacterized protein n=1 Tax=Lodderomyces elongisporus (strain ATCC 11503 / CBS 2605 / JCM 1781 / NBRC 1676 / NRRL YB-4239) TaxID=379508 RepID=A5E7J6_LODEL|nr:hypothetical protein LELG_05585 [Lodderomyces elongisporus NRRL YB-4239]
MLFSINLWYYSLGSEVVRLYVFCSYCAWRLRGNCVRAILAKVTILKLKNTNTCTQGYNSPNNSKQIVKIIHKHLYLYQIWVGLEVEVQTRSKHRLQKCRLYQNIRRSRNLISSILKIYHQNLPMMMMIIFCSLHNHSLRHKYSHNHSRHHSNVKLHYPMQPK